MVWTSSKLIQKNIKLQISYFLTKNYWESYSKLVNIVLLQTNDKHLPHKVIYGCLTMALKYTLWSKSLKNSFFKSNNSFTAFA